MQKFSEFVQNYKEWKEANHPGEALDEYDMSFIRESYAARVRATAKKTNNSKLLESYREWKIANGKGDKITSYDIAALKAIKEAKKEEPKLEKDLSEVEGSMTKVLSDAKDTLNKLKTKAEMESFLKDTFEKNGIDTKASNRLIDTVKNAKTDTDALSAIYNSILAGAKLAVVKETTFQKTLKEFAAYKEAKNLGPVTRAERAQLFERTRSDKSRIVESKVTVQAVFDKLNESKKCVALAQKRLSEGDVMGAADATMAAGQAVTGAEGDATAMATPEAPVPQEVVDQISQVKSAVDALAAQAGIASPVDMGSDPNAGVPAVTGAPADEAAAPEVAPEAAPVMESTKRMEDSKARVTEAKKCDCDKEGIEVPPLKDLVKGTATGASEEAAPAETWPTEKIDEVPQEKKLDNVKESEEFSPDTESEKIEETAEEETEAEEKMEESKGLAEQRLEAELARKNFNWGAFLKSGFNKR